MAVTIASRKAPAKGGKNKKLFGALGAVALLAAVKVGLPAVMGSSSAPPPPVITDRHLVKASALTKSKSGPVVAVSRPSRNPFSPPPGYAPKS